MNTIQTRKPQKNKFDLSREVKQTGNMGTLMPCFIQDVIPGDSFRVDTQQLIRFSPLLAPMMHNIDFKLDFFFVPYRLVWDEWKDFITGGEDGNDLPSYPRVEIKTGNRDNFITKGSLADYLGVPPYNAGPEGSAFNNVQDSSPTQNHYISVLPFRAYQLIYHEYFRDQNVGIEYEQHTGSGMQSWTSLADQMSLRKTNWEKDYFTSALPFLQRGGEVTLPLGGIAPITRDETRSSIIYRDGDGDGLYNDPVSQNYNDLGTEPDGALRGRWRNGDSYEELAIGANNLSADLSDATAISINELRKASALQQWLELMARAGSRYREQIHAIFGERIPDYTVQVPQYLGGGKTNVMISEVLSTYAQDGSTDRPQGDMTGHAIGLGDGLGFRQSFDEHGIILGLCRIVPKSSYVQGLSKFWQKFDKFDHFFPQFANLGEQEVHNKELYVSGNKATDDAVFGYQQRYAEYKYAQNRVAGDFRDTLAHWELSRRFNGAAPLLNQSFVECNPDTRIFAIEDEDEHKIWMNLYHRVDALRPIPYHSVPQLN